MHLIALLFEQCLTTHTQKKKKNRRHIRLLFIMTWLNFHEILLQYKLSPLVII